MNFSIFVIYGLGIVLGVLALCRGDGCFQRGLVRGVEHFGKLVPRMLCALVAAGFVAKLIPTEFIGRFLGADVGLVGILIGTLAGLIVPSGPVVAFSIGAAFASAGASVPALVSFITAWSLFAVHRVVIFEIPLLGFSFLRMRLLSVLILPPLAGGLTLVATRALSMVGM